MSWRMFWTCAGILGSIVVSLVWASTQVTFLFHHPRTAGVRVEVHRKGAIVVVPTSAKSASSLSTAFPNLEAVETEFDFGTMNPNSTARHDFTIRNTGTAPLKLRVGSTTCNCTVSEVADKDVVPGASTIVAVQWTTADLSPFGQTATIFSNDPNRKSIDFVVKGKVQMIAGFDRPEILLDAVEPDQPISIERLVYSQVWDAFSITDLQSEITDLKWESLTVDPAEAPQLEAKSVARLRITIPADAIRHRHQESLRLTIKSEHEEAHPLHLPLTAIPLRRLAFYGPAIDSDGVIYAGNTTEGSSKRVKLLVKVRDLQADLTNAKITVSPEFLVAAIQPQSGQRGIYDLTIDIPDNAPPCQYNSTPIGRVKIETGHPRLGNVELKMSFAVYPRRPL